MVFAPAARDDLLRLYDYIVDAASPDIAIEFIRRIEVYCRGFDLAPERGRARHDIRPGLRVVGFEKRVTIAFSTQDERVTILRIFYGGRNWEDFMSPKTG